MMKNNDKYIQYFQKYKTFIINICKKKLDIKMLYNNHKKISYWMKIK